ncbi:hypothetical protein [Neomicrococcus aestuarii]|uniref:Uncharacterized protein n=1 Tax=Neomicrococcus aestuarii TaxID=556325 RepID=A0A1L2ZPA0_9MICC|nr:hypothetical protein [Neomicrococcus aestuarii]APF40841.1 hypothetical protein BHE16_07230 [Neomicrococcus aestuarii]
MTSPFGSNANPIEELSNYFKDSPDPVARGKEWALEVARDASLDPAKQGTQLVRAMQKREPAFDLVTLTYLAKAVANE